MADVDAAGFDALTTEELRERAFSRAEKHLDVGFFWDLFKHLPASGNAASDDSFSGAGASVGDFIELFREFRGEHLAPLEPMLRAKFIDYLTSHGERP